MKLRANDAYVLPLTEREREIVILALSYRCQDESVDMRQQMVCERLLNRLSADHA